MHKSKLFLISIFTLITTVIEAKVLEVCSSCSYTLVQDAINIASPGDTVLLKTGTYNEHDIIIEKSITLLSNKDALIDAEGEGYGLIIKADSVYIKGIGITNVGQSYTKDFAAIHFSKCNNFRVENCRLSNVFFGVLIEKSHHGLIRKNHISSNAITEAGSGNGVHMWSSSHLKIIDNELEHLRDGIYFEFVTESTTTHNYSHDNLRYGLHFMFSNNDEYHYNKFSNNGAGVAVMFSKFIKMTNNTFTENWGAASYGLLLKEIYDAEIVNNVFKENTMGIFTEGSTRINYINNDFEGNGWAMKVSGACYTNVLKHNNFVNNSFDISYNSKVHDNKFDYNYWSDYTGYDLDKDGEGDIPYRPVKLFSYIVNRTPETILLLRSLFIEILNFSEKVSPVFTPDNLLDNHPQTKRIS
jgi:nitrous oxidase accessory protein